MGKKRKQLPLLENIVITDVAAEGKAIAKVDGLAVFVPFAVPGDVVDIQLTRKKNSYAEGRVVRFEKYAEKRAVPFCSHFGVCGGCKWQMLPYDEQLKQKQRQVTDNLVRIGKIDLPESNPILGAPQTTFYRNKLEFTFSNKKWLTEAQIGSGETFDNMNALGFHIPGMFDKVLNVEKCWLQDDLSNQIRNAIRDFCLEKGYTFFDLRNQTGLMRTLIIRNTSIGEWMVIVVFYEDDQEKRENLMAFIAAKFPQITSLLYIINQKANDTITDQEVVVWRGNDQIFEMEEGLRGGVESKLNSGRDPKFEAMEGLGGGVESKLNPGGDQKFEGVEGQTDGADSNLHRGRDYIFEEMEGLKFKIGPKSFFQTNSEQAFNLYKVTRDFAQLSGQEIVYDLYTGTGSIANFVARNAKKVVGIEYVPEAIYDAKENSRLNGIENTLFFAGDMKDVLTADFIAQHGRPDVVITDPPRAGMHTDVVDAILLAAPQRIVYVSCNPATQARDLSLLDAKYKVVQVQTVDMFPHTQHVENVVLLEER